MKKTKYYYFFKPDLDSHVHFYAGWVNIAIINGLPIKMISFINIKNYYKNYSFAKRLKQESNAIIIPVPSFLRNFITILFFSFVSLGCDEVLIHLKKVNPKVFDLMKIYNKKLKYIIDLEGDPECEIDYLIKHPYKKEFYDQIIKNLESQTQNYKETLIKSDYIFTVTEKLKERIILKYPTTKNKIGVLPTGVDDKTFYFSEKIRIEKREELCIEDKFVIIFTGNVFYSWQNLKRTLEVFLILKKIKKNAFLILLIKESDICIAQEFIQKVGINENDYFLDSVSNKEVNNFLNAADLGVLLRDNHIMNQVASPGKIGEYAVTGLPILSTESSSSFSKELAEYRQMIMIDDLGDDQEILIKISEYDFDCVNRIYFQNVSRKFFSNYSYIEDYIKVLKKCFN